MKKRIVFLLVLTMIAGLVACQKPAQDTTGATMESTVTEVTTLSTVMPTETSVAEAPEKATEDNGAASALPTEAPTEVPATVAPAATETEVPTETSVGVPETDAPTAEPTEAPTEVPHSDFYVAGVTADQMVTYFNEVVLAMEYTTGDGDASLLQKWDREICYRIEGVLSKQDAKIISSLCKEFNEIEGFPGIRAATGLEQNLSIYFLRDEEFETQFSHLIDGETADGAVQFWYYNDTNGIYNGRIGYRKNIAQEIRNSVIPEEIINALGISDTVLREDSITYQYGSEVTELSEVDWAIVKLLYNPQMKCGMNATQCEAVIRELYY